MLFCESILTKAASCTNPPKISIGHVTEDASTPPEFRGENRAAKIIPPMQISQVLCRGHRQSKSVTEKKVIVTPQASDHHNVVNGPPPNSDYSRRYHLDCRAT